METGVKLDAATYAHLRALAGSEKRARLDIVKDLIRFDLTRCKAVSVQQHTTHLTAVLSGMPTETMPTERIDL